MFFQNAWKCSPNDMMSHSRSES